ncbi:MAG: DUF2080 family transposase-associated protein [Nanoarchaeota archaeon]|nr:DUF2080 family transposase-associated protein [Nanoarchaeota archaeon]
MKQELVKSVVKLGNSACVMLPKGWVNGKAKVVLVEEPINIKKDIFEILGDCLDKVVGIYLVGSYGRGDFTDDSDVDVLVVTSGIDKRIEKGKYEIILISADKLEKQLEKNVLPLLPMIKEAKGIINDEFIEKYKKVELTRKNLKFHFETSRSAMKVVKENLKLSEEMGTKEGAIAYSLVLRMRGVYIIDCIMKKKMWSRKEFLKLVRDVSGSGVIYDMYAKVKMDKKVGNLLEVKDAWRMHDWILEKLIKQEILIKKNEKK